VETCRKEKEDVVWDALYEKVKALAVVERTGVGEGKDMSSEDILKRLFLNTVGACKQVKCYSSLMNWVCKDTLLSFGVWLTDLMSKF
jgi:hypothetical protein